MELTGFEPATFSLRTRRATSCATAPNSGDQISTPGAPTPTAREPYSPAARRFASTALRSMLADTSAGGSGVTSWSSAEDTPVGSA